MLVLKYQSLIISCAFQFLYCSFYSSVCDAFFHLLSDTLQNTLFKNNLKPSHRVVSINKLVASCSRIYTFSDNLQNKRAEHNQQGESIFVQDDSMGRKEKKKKKKLIDSFIHSEVNVWRTYHVPSTLFPTQGSGSDYIARCTWKSRTERVKTQRTLHNCWNSS